VEIKLKCECGQVLKVGSDAAGKTGRCPSCNSPIRIPSLEEIEAARKSKPVELELEPEEPEEEEAPEKPGTGKFKAPTRSKTRSKALAELHGDDERGKSDTRARRGEKGRGRTRAKTRTKTRSKTKGRSRSKTSVMDKYRKKSADDEEEGGYARKKKNPLKILIIIGIVVIGGLIAAYAVHWGPKGKATKRTKRYIGAMNTFVRDVKDRFLRRYSSKMPASDNDFKRYLQDIKDDAGMVQGSVNRKMENAYKADDLMHEIIRTLDKDALAIIKERMEKDAQARITNEDLVKFNDRFTAEIAKVNARVADIEKLLDTVRPQVGLRRVLLGQPGR
jgi:hypothetical protein